MGARDIQQIQPCQPDPVPHQRQGHLHHRQRLITLMERQGRERPVTAEGVGKQNRLPELRQAQGRAGETVNGRDSRDQGDRPVQPTRHQRRDILIPTKRKGRGEQIIPPYSFHLSLKPIGKITAPPNIGHKKSGQLSAIFFSSSYTP